MRAEVVPGCGKFTPHAELYTLWRQSIAFGGLGDELEMSVALAQAS